MLHCTQRGTSMYKGPVACWKNQGMLLWLETQERERGNCGLMIGVREVGGTRTCRALMDILRVCTFS